MEESKFKTRLKQILKTPGIYFLAAALTALLYAVIRIFSLGLVRGFAIGLALGIGLAMLAAAGFLFYFNEKKMGQLLAMLLCAVIMLLGVTGTHYMDLYADAIYNISGPRMPYTLCGGIYTTAGGDETLAFLNGQTLGVLEGRTDAINEDILAQLEEKGIEVHTQSYSTLQALYKAVRGQAVRAIILSPYEVAIAQDFSGTKDNDLKCVFSLERETSIATNSNADIDLEEDSYTVLISASNAPLSDPSYRSTLNLVASVNPHTQTVLYTVLPRNLWTASTCSEELACLPADEPDKLSYISYHSSEALRQSVEALLEVPVDFVVRIDLQSLAKLMDVSDGLGIDTSMSFGADNGPAGQFTVMTGPRVIQYLGVLSDFSSGDFDQELNQLRFLASLYNQRGQLADLEHISQSTQIISRSISTTFTYQQLCELIRYNQLIPRPSTVLFQSIDGVYETMLSPTLTEHAYVLEAKEESLSSVRTAIGQVLDGQETQTEGVLIPEQPAQ